MSEKMLQAVAFVPASLAALILIVEDSIPLRIVAALLFLISFILGVAFLRGAAVSKVERERVKDLSEKLKYLTEKSKEIESFRTRFLFSLADELRGPVADIRSFVSLLLEGTYGTLPKASEEGMTAIFDRTTDMAALIDRYFNETQRNPVTMSENTHSIRSVRIGITSESVE